MANPNQGARRSNPSSPPMVCINKNRFMYILHKACMHSSQNPCETSHPNLIFFSISHQSGLSVGQVIDQIHTGSTKVSMLLQQSLPPLHASAQLHAICGQPYASYMPCSQHYQAALTSSPSKSKIPHLFHPMPRYLPPPSIT